MNVVESTSTSCKYFLFEHSKPYQKVQFQFLDAVESLDPQTIMVSQSSQCLTHKTFYLPLSVEQLAAMLFGNSCHRLSVCFLNMHGFYYCMNYMSCGTQWEIIKQMFPTL